MRVSHVEHCAVGVADLLVTEDSLFATTVFVYRCLFFTPVRSNDAVALEPIRKRH